MENTFLIYLWQADNPENELIDFWQFKNMQNNEDFHFWHLEG